MSNKKLVGRIFILLGSGLLILVGAVAWRDQFQIVVIAPTATRTNFGPLVPPTVPEPVAEATATPGEATSPPLSPATVALPADFVQRFGITVSHFPFTDETAEALGVGWYVAWNVYEEPSHPNGAEYWQVIRLDEEEGFSPEADTIISAARKNPGATWLIGNEPDVKWQDNVTPGRYAALYHEVYTLLKTADPTAQVAIGGITQPTPLRLQYLDMVLAEYEMRYGVSMPVDMWNIHNFILREERDNWGVDIPPGLEADQGILYEVDDHDDMEVFKQQIINFRRWMAEQGQRDKPLIISEYGILMPEDFGFTAARVQKFMIEGYDFMLTASDAAIGYPADDNRLVQRWAWYSLNSSDYKAGNLIDPETGDLTPVGRGHQNYILNLFGTSNSRSLSSE